MQDASWGPLIASLSHWCCACWTCVGSPMPQDHPKDPFSRSGSGSHLSDALDRCWFANLDTIRTAAKEEICVWHRFGFLAKCFSAPICFGNTCKKLQKQLVVGAWLRLSVWVPLTATFRYNCRDNKSLYNAVRTKFRRFPYFPDFPSIFFWCVRNCPIPGLACSICFAPFRSTKPSIPCTTNY